jgi:hypothetical protein
MWGHIALMLGLEAIFFAAVAKDSREVIWLSDSFVTDFSSCLYSSYGVVFLLLETFA